MKPLICRSIIRATLKIEKVWGMAPCPKKDKDVLKLVTCVGRNYIMSFLLTVIFLIFAAGLCFGRITNRKAIYFTQKKILSPLPFPPGTSSPNLTSLYLFPCQTGIWSWVVKSSGSIGGSLKHRRREPKYDPSPPSRHLGSLNVCLLMGA